MACWKARVEFLLSVIELLFSERERSLFAVAHPSVVCLSSVTLVHPTQPIVIFSNITF